MAFTASAIVECQTGGDDTNNGAIFDPGVAGFPTDGAITSANTSAPVFSSVSYSFVSGDQPAYLYLKSGPAGMVAGWYPITLVSGGNLTLNAAVGAVVLANLSGMNTVAGASTAASVSGATWGIDYSRQAGSQITFTDMVIGGTTTTFTSTLKPVAKNYIGNSISVTSGSGFTVQRVVVVSTSGTTATCDKTLGTAASSSGNGRLGGAVASPSIAVNLLNVGGMVGFCLNGTYTISSNSTNITNGALAMTASCILSGYSGANRFFGNTGTAPLVQTSGSTIGQIQGTGVYYNFVFDGNNQTASTHASLLATFYACTIKNFNTANGVTTCFYVGCLITGNSVSMTGSLFVYCESYGNTASGFSGTAFKCLAYLNTGATSDGIALTASGGMAIECHTVSNGRTGIRPSASRCTVLNCHAQSNGTSGTGYGYGQNGTGQLRILNCTGYNNTTGLIDTTLSVQQWNVTAVSGDVYVDSANNNYALNTLTGYGAALRNAGRIAAVSTMPRGLTTPLFDIGGIQSRVPWGDRGYGG